MTADEGLFDVVLTPSAPGGRTKVRFEVQPADHRRGPVNCKASGPEAASAPNFWWREFERAALAIASERGEVSADDVRARFPEEPSATSAAIGAAFRRLSNQGRLVLVGHRRSTRPTRNGGVQGVWRLAGD
jgi:hypothetical protein